MMRIRDIPTGTPVAIYGTKVGGRNGAAMLEVPGVGESGRWEIVGSAYAEPQQAVKGPTLVYLAGPIDAVSQDVALGWRVALGSMLPESVVCFSPPSAYLGASMTAAEAVDRANRAIIRVCDVVVANLEGGPALGTMREVEYARSLGIPVIAISDSSVASLLSYDLTLVETLGDVGAALSHARRGMRSSLRDHRNTQGGLLYPPNNGEEAISHE